MTVDPNAIFTGTNPDGTKKGSGTALQQQLALIAAALNQHDTAIASAQAAISTQGRTYAAAPPAQAGTDKQEIWNSNPTSGSPEGWRYFTAQGAWLPFGQYGAAGGSAVVPPSSAFTVSADGTTVTPSANGTITDTVGDTWTFGAVNSSNPTNGNYIVHNGTADSATAATLLLLKTGVMYQANGSGLWWKWVNGGWQQVSGDPRAGGAPSSSGSIPSTIKLMGIGDSITAGQGGSGSSYFPELGTKLTAAGITATFVGSQVNNTYHSEGYPGQGVDNIKGYVTQTSPASILATPPDAIVLLIGTNDNSGYSGALNSSTYSVFNNGTSALLTEYGTLLDAIFTKAPNAYVFACKLTPRTGGQFVDETGFNNGLGSIVQTRFAAGKHCYMVDLYTNFPSSTGLADGLHPNDSVGYPWIGDRLSEAIAAAFQASPGVTAPSQATAQGLTKLAYDVETWTSSLIDTTNTKTAGFKLYTDRPYASALTSGNYSVASGVLTITGDGAGPNYSLASTCRDGAGGWRGFTVYQNWYIEGEFQLLGTGTGSGWNSFWLMDAEHLWQGTGHGGEEDIFEYFQQAFGWQNSWIGFTIHDHQWTSSGDTQNDPVVDLGSSWDPTAWHKYGELHIAATPSSQGYAAFYVDDVLKKTVTWNYGGTFSINDSVHQTIILGTGGSASMKCRALRAWTK
jgi:lysophospholipase L1-like esterase